MSEKVQYMALVDPSTRDRLDALRIVMRESRARIGEMAWLSGGIGGMELGQVRRIERLHRVAEKAGVDWQEYARQFAARYSRRYGPTLEELEKDPKLGLKEKRKRPAPAEAA